MFCPLDKMQARLDRPIRWQARVTLVVLAAALAFSYAQPLWSMRMEAPQYPKGLGVDVYAYKVVGGHGGQDLTEINNLNHYIGMGRIDRAALVDLDWIPFALGVLILLALRTAVLGTTRTLVDLSVLSLYVAVFAAARFLYRLHAFGHDLDPKAAFTVEPFMPVVMGRKQIANFTTEAWPQLGSYLLLLFVLGVLVLAIWHVLGRRSDAPAPAPA